MIKNILIGAALVMAATSLFFSLYGRSHKTVYINSGKIYEEFALSKELNKQLEDMLKKRKFLIDSLYEDLRQQTTAFQQQGSKDANEFTRLSKKEEDLVYKRDMLEKESQTTINEYNARIWNQLNQYLLDYGSDHDYQFILGANGQGNIMYGNKDNEVTEEVVAYVNQRYDDKFKK